MGKVMYPIHHPRIVGVNALSMTTVLMTKVMSPIHHPRIAGVDAVSMTKVIRLLHHPRIAGVKAMSIVPYTRVCLCRWESWKSSILPIATANISTMRLFRIERGIHGCLQEGAPERDNRLVYEDHKMVCGYLISNKLKENKQYINGMNE